MNDKLIRALSELNEMWPDIVKAAEATDGTNPADVSRFKKIVEPYDKKARRFEVAHRGDLKAHSWMMTCMIVDGVKEGRSVEEILCCSDFGLNLDTANFLFKVKVENGVDTIVGGELCTTDAYGLLRVQIDEEKVSIEPVVGYLDGCKYGFILDVLGEDIVKSAMIGFFRREHLRIQKRMFMDNVADVRRSAASGSRPMPR